MLATASTVFFTAQGMLFPVLPRFVDRELGGGAAAVGVAVSSFAIGAMAARPWGGHLADRLGRRVVAGAGALLWAVMVALYAVAGEVAGLGGLITVRAIGGIGGGALFVALATMATDLAPPDQRVRGFGLFSASTLLGFAIGPAIGEELLDGHRYGLTFLVCGALALAPLVATAVLPETKPAETPPGDRAPWREMFVHPAARRPGAAMLLGSLGFVTFTAFVPLHAEDVGLDNVAIPLTVSAAVNLFTRVAGASMADRVDRRTLTGVSLVTVAAAALTLAAWASPTGVIVAAALNGAGNAYLFPGFLAMTVDAAPEADRARAIGSLTVFSDLANSAGGALLGVAAAVTGYRGAFGLAAALAMGSLAVVLFARPRRTAAADVLRPL